MFSSVQLNITKAKAFKFREGCSMFSSVHLNISASLGALKSNFPPF